MERRHVCAPVGLIGVALLVLGCEDAHSPVQHAADRRAGSMAFSLSGAG